MPDIMGLKLMWSQTFVLADRIKGTLVACVLVLAAISTVVDVTGYAEESILPLMIFGVVAQTIIVVAALKVDHAKARPRLNAARVFGIVLLSGLGFLLGLLFLVIPGFFLLIRWWVAVPLALDRDIGVMESLRESWDMTADYVAPIFWVLAALSVIFAMLIGAMFLTGAADEELMSLLPSLLFNLVTYGVTNIGTVSTVAVYRTISGSSEDLRTIFE